MLLIVYVHMNFLLPKYPGSFDLNDYKLTLQNEPASLNIISQSFHHYITTLKNCIHQQPGKWSNFKMYTNTYEYIHGIYENKNCVCKINPVSRSFYKLIEIDRIFHVIHTGNVMKTLHIAEGPGGFIQATKWMRKERKKNITFDIHVGVTLQSNDHSVPTWKKLKDLYRNDNNVVFDNGSDQTGNLYNTCNLKHFFSKYKNSMNLITADGGFDFSLDYNQQESNVLKLLLVQCFYAILCQSKNGTFIMKVFDIFKKGTCDILFFLNMFYDEIHVVKPHTSRIGNSEKYLVCRRFKHTSTEHLFNTFYGSLQTMENQPNAYVHSIFNHDLHDFFMKQIESINSIIGQKQVENINSTLLIINNPKQQDVINQLKKNNLMKCIYWCVKHNLPIHPYFYNLIPYKK